MEVARLGSLFGYVGSYQGTTVIVSTLLILLMLYVLVKFFNVGLTSKIKGGANRTVRFAGRKIRVADVEYNRDVAIGRLSSKSLKVKTYKFMNDLIIDLGLKNNGVTPYELILLVVIASILMSLLSGLLVFRSVLMGILIVPIMTGAVICALYTKANIAHDARIEAVIESENIISNNIKGGVTLAISTSLDVLPASLRDDFQDYLDNINTKNYHPKAALLELNSKLGSISDDFIRKCINFELDEQHGVVGMFQDLVEINNTKTELRIEMKRSFENVVVEYVVGASMVFAFLAGAMAMFEVVSHFYLYTRVGQLILIVDALILIGEFVFITRLRAKEL